MKQTDNATTQLIIALGVMAAKYRPLLDVALAVIRGVNPHASRAEWGARIYQVAASALCQKYDDVERRSGPEAYRLSDCTRAYTRAEKLIMLETLHSCCDEWIGPGWAAQQCATELGIALPEFKRRG